MKPLLKQKYPLSVDSVTAEKIVSEIHALVHILTKGSELNKKEYKKLNKITSQLVHPVI